MSRQQRYYSQNYSLVDNSEDFSYEYSRSNTPQPHQPPQHFPDELPVRSTKVGGLSYGDDPLHHSGPRPGARFWTRQRKIIAASAAAILAIIIIALGVGLGVGLKHKGSPFTFILSDKQVTNQSAFTNGGATKANPNNTNDGVGDYKDEYTYYQGDWTKFPKEDTWVSFQYMWNSNMEILQTSCETLGHGSNMDNTTIGYIYDAIQNRSAASLVDHRFIFAIILQETKGCVNNPKTNNGVNNPGIMQSHDGHSYDPDYPQSSILAMVQDGTQGTATGPGLLENLDLYGNAYSAARAYNSGQGAFQINGDLSQAYGATKCYVSDVANRLQGWVYAKSTCQD